MQMCFSCTGVCMTHKEGGVSDIVWVTAWMDSIRWSEQNEKLQKRLEHVPLDAG